jgi:hypothetical protein
MGFSSLAILAHVVAECLNLLVAAIRVFLITNDPSFPIIAQSTSDLRVVVRAENRHSYAEDWQAGARGSDDFWVRAERFISLKRKGEIDGTSVSLARYSIFPELPALSYASHA